MNLVDSSGGLEYFADGDNADFFAPAITETEGWSKFLTEEASVMLESDHRRHLAF